MRIRKHLTILLVFALCMSVVCAYAHARAEEELRLGMTIEEVEAIWGKPAGKDSLNGFVRWYCHNGRTLICAFSWCDPEEGTWTNGRFSANAVWGLGEWIEFDEKDQRVGGNVPENENVFFVMQQFIDLPSDDIPRAHDIGSGFSIPAKITSDGWIVEDDIGPTTTDCLDRGWLEQLTVVPLGIWGFIRGWLRK